MRTTSAATIGIIGFFLILGSFGALDLETVSLAQGTFQAVLGIGLVMLGMSIGEAW